MASDLPTVTEPFPISLIHGRYLLFSIDAITYIRRVHHITGVLIGSIPQIPQQNVFLGIPLQLMPEEARLLVEKGAAYIIDDARLHVEKLQSLKDDERKKYVEAIKQKGVEAGRMIQAQKDERTAKAFARMTERTRDVPARGSAGVNKQSGGNDVDRDSLFETEGPKRETTPSHSGASGSLSYAITPTTSAQLFIRDAQSQNMSLPEVPGSYPLFKHLHSNGYYLSPGLRFGCQYLAYPGDPLRFHSHFLAANTEWDEEIKLLDLVGGGRLGTGVKKSFLIGGLESKASSEEDSQSDCANDARVRTFCIEWAGM